MIQAIIKKAAESGVVIAISVEGAIDITGRKEDVASWLSVLRKNKADILAALGGMESLTPQSRAPQIKSVTSVSLVFQPPPEKISDKASLPSWTSAPSIEAITRFKTGYPWITLHLVKLLAAGWTRRELFGRGRHRWPIGDWGAAWVLPFDQPEKIPGIGRHGEIVFTFPNCHGELAQQTAWPVKLLSKDQRG
ncbi:MAG: hypothetical protein OEL83_04990 [Desulforhopalus sp.]|nr:hypothetical protein [Desulforhopalus sp.]